MRVDLKRAVGQIIVLLIAFSLALFLPAGTLAWPAAWLFLVLFFGFFIAINVWLARYNPGLLQERLNFGTADQQGPDKIIFPILLLFPFLWLAFIGLDARRFHWSAVPLWVEGLGGLLVLGSFYLFFLTFRENSYLSTVVRVQKDRGHQVISTGPYHYVRHPMYSGMLLFMLGTPLLLGSAYGVLVGLLLVLALAWRARLEERTLLRELTGYDTYMTQVRYRFIPFVW